MSVPSSPVCKTPLELAATSKRHSLNISTGPRPLHLVEAALSCSPSPTTPLSTPSISSAAGSDSEVSSIPSSACIINGLRPHSARRQSSISYKSQDRTRPSPLAFKQTTTRSSSPPRSSGPVAADRGSISSASGINTPDRVPRTLAEKHGELLHFIAQKESKCLELRTQLALHEAELLQLKRKWERIVSRRFGSADDTITSSNVMLEGIKEGVQGVSRFIAAGLSDFSSPPLQPPPAPSQARHSAQPSTSSVSTSTTQSTRFSESSASSFGDETYPQEVECHELMVHDTGATPTVSPNPAFVHQQQQLKAREEEEKGGSVDTFAASETAGSMMHLEKLRETPGSSRPSRQVPPDSVVQPPTTDSGNLKQALKMKRASGHPSDLPISGLGSLAVVGANVVPPLSSWMGSVGRKWEELQRGTTFSKNQKRASVLLSDVSQSIVSALSPPPPPVNAPANNPSRGDGTRTLPTKLLSSLIDDTDTLDGPPGTIMLPESGTSTQTHSSNASDSLSSPSQPSDEEWNW